MTSGRTIFLNKNKYMMPTDFDGQFFKLEVPPDGVLLINQR